MEDNNFDKAYYDKLKKKVDQHNENNEFYNEFTNAIKSGKFEIYQKRIKEAQLFDVTWIDTVEEYIKNIDSIVRNPKLFMTAVEDVVKVEKAKKINAKTVQHLASHTQFVRDIDTNGDVTPSQVLTYYYEDEIGIYENRFVMTLINKLNAFIEIRFAAIKDSIRTVQADRLNVNSSFKWRNYSIDCNIDMKVKEDIDDELNRKNIELYNRIKEIRVFTRSFLNSSFYKSIKAKHGFVHSPILRTNIILKSVDYNCCLKLWQFLDSYRQLGFDVDTMEKNLDLDASYIDDITNLITFDYSALVSNQEQRKEDYRLKPYKFKQDKNPKIIQTLVNENLVAGDEEMEAPTANEYFYQRTKKNLKNMYTDLIKTGKNYNQSLATVYKKMQAIANSVYKDLFDNLEDQLPKEVSYKEKRKAKFDFLKRKVAVMKSIAWMKEMDAKNAAKEVERLNDELAKFTKEEAEYQAMLKEQRRETLRKAREERKNRPLTPTQEEVKNAIYEDRLAKMALAREKKAEEKAKWQENQDINTAIEQEKNDADAQKILQRPLYQKDPYTYVPGEDDQVLLSVDKDMGVELSEEQLALKDQYLQEQEAEKLEKAEAARLEKEKQDAENARIAKEEEEKRILVEKQQEEERLRHKEAIRVAKIVKEDKIQLEALNKIMEENKIRLRSKMDSTPSKANKDYNNRIKRVIVKRK